VSITGFVDTVIEAGEYFNKDKAPTLRPTQIPTNHPTSKPTLKPTNEPFLEPSSKPTHQPPSTPKPTVPSGPQTNKPTQAEVYGYWFVGNGICAEPYSVELHTGDRYDEIGFVLIVPESRPPAYMCGYYCLTFEDFNPIGHVGFYVISPLVETDQHLYAKM